jgi:hypothetical protein
MHNLAPRQCLQSDRDTEHDRVSRKTFVRAMVQETVNISVTNKLY